VSNEVLRGESDSVRVLPPEHGSSPPGPRPPPRSGGWLRFGLPSAAIAVLIGILLADTDLRLNDSSATESAPPQARAIPVRVEIGSPTLPDRIPLSWSSRRFEETHLIRSGLESGSIMAAVEGPSGAPALLRLEPSGAQLFDIPDVAYLHTAIPTGDGLLLVARHNDVQGLDDLDTVIAAAADLRLFILGYNQDSVQRAWIDGGLSNFRSVSATGLSGPDIDVVIRANGLLFAGGTSCGPSGCSAAVWRSLDGLSWTAARGFEQRPGRVTGLAMINNTLHAVGTVDPGLGRAWTSTDLGLTWQQDAAPELATTLSITVTGIERDDRQRSLRLDISGDPVHIAEGGTLATPIGDVTVVALGDVAVLALEDEVRPLRIGETWALQPNITITDLTTHARRLVAVGSRVGADGSTVPLIWIRSQDEPVWHSAVLPARIEPTEVRLTMGTVAVFGSDGADMTVMTAELNLVSPESTAVDAVTSLLDAIESGELRVATELLAPSQDLDLPFSLPGSMNIPFNIWTTEGSIDHDALRGAIEYVTTLDTHFSTRECDASPTFSGVETVRVTCDYTVTSSLLSALGGEPSSGTFVSLTQEGRVVSMRISSHGEEETLGWLMEFAAAFFPDTGATAGPERVDAELAAVHLEAAAAMNDYALRPDQTRIANTLFGRLELSWISAPFGPEAEYASAVVWDGAAYAALVEDPTALANGTIWRSSDGLEWWPDGPGPPAVGFVDHIESSPGGLLAWSHEPQLRMWLRSDDVWQELTLPAGFDEDTWITDFAVGAGRAAAVWTAGAFGESSSPKLLVIDPDGSVRRVDPGFEGPSFEVALVGHPDGFVMMIDGERNQLWSSPDGETWVLRTEAPRGALGWPLDLQWHNDNVLMYTEADWQDSCGMGVYADCRPALHIWRSAAGEPWEEAPLVLQGIEGRAIAKGDLGYVAASVLDAPGLLVWLSTDGWNWSVPEDVWLTVPEMAWWPTHAAVGPDGFVLAVMIEEPFGEPTVSLMVARTLDDPDTVIAP
jgi:hypothetical protein